MDKTGRTGDPTITVVIPVFNGVNYLAEAIDSVLAQSYQDYEILVVDDGSTDATRTLIERYCAAHPDVVRGLFKPNGGTASALNAGIRAAKGQFVAWLSHDDRFVPHKLATQIRALQECPTAAGVYSDYHYINATGTRIGYVHAAHFPPEKMMRHLLQNTFINGSTLLIQRRYLLEAGLFDEDLPFAHDAMMWLHLAHRFQLTYVPQALTEYRLHPAQATRMNPVHRDLWRVYDRALAHFTLEDIFPELSQPHTSGQDRAGAYAYLGDVLWLHSRYVRLGLMHYRKAWLAWPRWQNPALPRLLLTALKTAARLVRRRMKQGLFLVSAHNAADEWIEIDLQAASQLVKDF